MWVPLILYLFVNIKNVVSIDTWEVRNDPVELTDLFLDNLKADPSLVVDHEISERSKIFINNKIEKFVYLVTQSQNAVSRTKRSLNDKESNSSRYSINITPHIIIPTKYSTDLRIFKHGPNWFAVSLQDGNRIAIFEKSNGVFKEILNQHIEYTTNLAVSSTGEMPIIVVGENQKVRVFQFDFANKNLRSIQTLKGDKPEHVVMWEQAHTTYLSVTEILGNNSKNDKDQISKITIYTWLGRHFDLKQEIQLFNIKKTVPFNIHGSYFLAAVKYKPHEDELKSYSEIFKFNLHSAKFEIYQRVLTSSCTDIKYFASELHGERGHFLVVVHSTERDSSETGLQDTLRSVIYKYEDQYFIPFQSLQTDAVEWQPVEDNKGHAALLAVTKYGLKGFQYDGWNFFESNIAFNEYNNLKYEDITALHTYNYEEEQILVLACDHCKNTTNVLRVNFTNFNSMKDLHSEVLSWCTESLRDLELIDSDLVAEPLRGDLNEQISLEEDQKRQLAAALRNSNEILVTLEDLVDNSLQSNKDHTFDTDIYAENVIFNDNVDSKSLETTSLNDINIDNLLEDVLDINDGFVINDLAEFNVISSEKLTTPNIINNVPLEYYVFLDNDTAIENLVISGDIIFNSGVNIEQKLNNITVNKQHVLLKTGDQEFSRDLRINDIIVHNLTTNYLNGIDLSSLKSTTSRHSQAISHIDTLKVDNLTIGGLLNNVSIPALLKHALKKEGDQILEETFSFDLLTVKRLNVSGKISGKTVPEDFVMIDSGEYTVDQDVNFLRGFKANKLEVLDSLNNITVTEEGELDILLTDSPYIQIIPGKKIFESLTITNPIKLRNKIKNDQMERINPVLIDSYSYEIDDDVTIEGVTEVGRWLKVEDLKGKNGQRSFKDVLRNGVKITDKEMPVHLTFTKSIDLDDTVADRVNFLNPHDWLLVSSDSPQIVKGEKTILGDLHLQGQVSAFRLNDVDVNKLQKDVLRINGDQEIQGVLEFDRLIANKGITGNITYYGENLLNTKLQTNEDTEETQEVAINGNVIANITRTKHLEVKGQINSLNISETVRNIVRKDAKYKVFGQKMFKELHVKDLIIREKESDLIKLLRDVMNNEANLRNNLDLFNEIKVENINFALNLNNMTKENFTNMMNFKSVSDDMTTVTSDREYEQITVFGEVYINDNFINGKNLSSIENDTVKADENYEFEHVKFGEAIFVEQSLQLEGNIENLDLNNIVDPDSKDIMEIKDKIFNQHLFINDTLNIENTLNGVDIKKFCDFSRASSELKTLKIEGDVMFVKGPKVLNINGLNVKDLMENLWFVDHEVNISGTVRLPNATFISSIDVKEFIDENNLKLLYENYFSKSKDQTIASTLSFDDITLVNISTPKLFTKGPINGIILDDLLKTMLLQNVTQVFESPVYFEEVYVDVLNEETSYAVNGLNFETDVMLYDAKNIVTGRKIVNDLDVNLIKLNRNIKIQDVDVLEWLGNALLTKGTFQVTGKKILKNATFKQGLSLRGKLNDQEFNEKTIMLVDTPQNITGKKNFVLNDKDITKFKILKTNGMVNGMHFEDFMKSQSKKNQNNVINSEIVFNNSVVVKNINVDVMYDDVNVTELLANITKIGTLEHLQQKYKNLLDMSIAIENSVKNQASLFKYFKEVMYLDDVYEVFGLKCKDEIFRLLAYSFENGTNIFKTYEWNEYTKEFVLKGANIESYSRPNYIEQISINGYDYIYIEHPTNHYVELTHHPLHFGQLVRLMNSTTFEPVAQFERNATKSLISFVLPGLNQPCLGFINVEMSGMQIFCDETGSHEYYWLQTINMERVYKATSVRTQDFLYLFLAREGYLFKEPSIVVFENYIGSPEFIKKQTIFEGTNLNGLATALIGNMPYVAFSFGPQEATINKGRILIRKLDHSTQKFIPLQHIPITAPLGAHFITAPSFGPLLLAPSADASAPLQTLRYDGVAGFKKNLKGSALPPRSRIRIIQDGKFVVALQDDRGTGIILRSVVKGPVIN